MLKQITSCLFLLLLSACQTLVPPTPATSHTPFIHPGILHTRADLDLIKSKVASKQEPQYAAWTALRLSPKASLDFTPHPLPRLYRGSKNNPNIGAADLLIDGSAAYIQAIQWYLTDNPAYAQKAIQILNAYASTVKSIDGSDTPLVSGEAAIQFAAAAEIIRFTYHTNGGWPLADQEKFALLLRTVFYPNIENFKPTNNGNWDAAMIASMLAMGVYFDDHIMFDRALAQATSPTSNGSIQNYFDEKGECQESGRDQSHAQMGLAFLGQACQVAWTQNIDLYAAFNNRLLLGTEYITKYNLGNDVPYTPYQSIVGKNLYPTISPKSRGKFSGIYEKIYHHYHDLKHLDMPYTEKVILQNRPEPDLSNSFLPWGTLMFAQ